MPQTTTKPRSKGRDEVLEEILRAYRKENRSLRATERRLLARIKLLERALTIGDWKARAG